MRGKTHTQMQLLRHSHGLALDTPTNADVHALGTHHHTLRDMPSHDNQDGEDQAKDDLGCSNIPTPQLL